MGTKDAKIFSKKAQGFQNGRYNKRKRVGGGLRKIMDSNGSEPVYLCDSEQPSERKHPGNGYLSGTHDRSSIHLKGFHHMQCSSKSFR
ncbi:hypothetical protein T265_02411 [Opisthorchis viverrini]|uniref:Uncharacterized protein n=1 Tax=Opisthorchis viverrini TaxID=6198 RepID=A0A074ZZC5_OPIVI|nr:hypothetical protein T265_02411 [Opisthorchis viverrini]KER31362.1 hypothetical protein T265_02411 [Opisthorchis viverrini]